MLMRFGVAKWLLGSVVGCGLAGGKWERIEPLILNELAAKGIAVYVYDFT